MVVDDRSPSLLKAEGGTHFRFDDADELFATVAEFFLDPEVVAWYT